MKITVTQKHIERGRKSSISDCALAIAINEQCPTYEASVGGPQTGIMLRSLSDQSVVAVIPMPLRVLAFVADFDCGTLPKQRFWHRRDIEYTFDLAIPENVTEPVRSTSVPERLESEVAAI